MNTYEELSKEEKSKFKAYNLWLGNWARGISWFISFLLIIVLLAGMAGMFLTGIERDLWGICYIAYAILIGCMTIKQVKIMKKARKLIFGIEKDENMHFFGISDEDTKVTWREMLRNYGKD